MESTPPDGIADRLARLEAIVRANELHEPECAYLESKRLSRYALSPGGGLQACDCYFGR